MAGVQIDGVNNKIDFDDDQDTSISANTDDTLVFEIAGATDFTMTANKFEVATGSVIDINGTELVLDADADTSITADTDDQIDFKIGGNDTHVFDANGHVVLKQFLDATTAGGRITGASNRGNVARINMYQSAGSADGGQIRLETANSSNSMTERMRITKSGDVLIGRTDATIDSSNAGIALRYYGEVKCGRTDAGATSPVFQAFGNAGQIRIMGDGDAENTNNQYGSISDERIKTNITDANSQWNDIKAIEVKNFERKDDVAKYGAGKKIQIGVIAQQVESVSPKLIKEREPTEVEINMSSEFGTLYTADDAETKDGNDAVLYTSDDDEVKNGTAKAGDIKTEATHSKKVGDIKETKDQVKSVGYSVLYMKAIKALQEAMAKIETLETKVKALEDA